MRAASTINPNTYSNHEMASPTVSKKGSIFFLSALYKYATHVPRSTKTVKTAIHGLAGVQAL